MRALRAVCVGLAMLGAIMLTQAAYDLTAASISFVTLGGCLSAFGFGGVVYFD